MVDVDVAGVAVVSTYILVFCVGYSIAWVRAKIHFAKLAAHITTQFHQRLVKTQAEYDNYIRAIKEEHANHLKWLGQNRAESE